MIRKLLRLGSHKPDTTKDDEYKAAHDDVIADLDSVMPTFRTKQIQAVQNVDFYMGRQWTDEQYNRIEQQFRYPYVFNEIKDKVDHLRGTQQQTRLDVKILPREKADENAAELLNFLVKWAEQVNNLEFIESEICKDGLLTGIGVATIRWGMSDMVFGHPIIERVPFNEIYWDGDSREIDQSDARWQARVCEMQRGQVRELFPEAAEIINKAAPTGDYSYTGYASPVLTHRQQMLSSTQNASPDHDDRSYLQVIEHYRLVQVEKYVVVDEIDGTETEFESEKEATEHFDGVIAGYNGMEKPPSLLNPDGSDRVSLQSITTDRAIQTVMVGNEVIIHQATGLSFLPFVVFYCNFFDGEYSGFVDQLIDPQILVNRNFSQLDYAMGASAKQAVTVIPSMLIDKTKAGIQSVGNELSRTAPYIPVMSHDALRFHANQPVNPELFSNIQFGLGRIETYSGGKNALGRTESAAESGRAVIARAEAGGVAKIPIFDNLRLWRKTLTEQLMWYIKNYMEPGQIVNIIGLDQRLRFYDLDDGVIDTIREMRGDVTVDEAIKSESVRERQFQQVREFAQVAQLPAELVLPFLVELSSLPHTVKDEITGSIEWFKEYQTKKAEGEKQEAERRAVESQMRKKQVREELENAQGVKQAEEDKLKLRNVEMELEKTAKARMEAEDAHSLEQRVNALDNLSPTEAQGVGVAASLTR